MVGNEEKLDDLRTRNSWYDKNTQTVAEDNKLKSREKRK